jgi:hypothetical protein
MTWRALSICPEEEAGYELNEILGEDKLATVPLLAGLHTTFRHSDMTQDAMDDIDRYGSISIDIYPAAIGRQAKVILSTYYITANR